MNASPTNVAIIIGSTREGRFGDVVTGWIEGRLSDREGFMFDVIDLRELERSTGDAAAHRKAVKEFRARIAQADAFIVVTPEYNHGYPAPLKLAIDSAYAEWHAKPVAFASYGGISGGLRAVEQLRQVFAELHAVTIRDGVVLPGAWRRFDDVGQPIDASTNDALDKMLTQLDWWAQTLRDARKARPYAA